jgi:hypothetical protein
LQVCVYVCLSLCVYVCVCVCVCVCVHICVALTVGEGTIIAGVCVYVYVCVCVCVCVCIHICVALTVGIIAGSQGPANIPLFKGHYPNVPPSMCVKGTYTRISFFIGAYTIAKGRITSMCVCVCVCVCVCTDKEGVRVWQREVY